MKEMHIAQVEFEEAKAAADLMSIFQDLGFTINALDRLSKLVSSDDEDPVLARSFWTAALVAYARCFATGKRFGLSRALFGDIEGGAEAHQLYIELRNKHVAHSVNPFEQVVAGLILSPPESSDRRVEGILGLSQSLLHLDLEGIRNLRRLALIALKYVEKLGRDYQEMALEIAKTMPLDDLYDRASPRTVAPGPEQAAKPRK